MSLSSIFRTNLPRNYGKNDSTGKVGHMESEYQIVKQKNPEAYKIQERNSDLKLAFLF
jgi:hypothetical protein